MINALNQPTSLALAALIALAGLSPLASATTIVSDNFSGGTNNATAAGRFPNLANLPGTAYAVWSQSTNTSIAAQPVLDTSSGDPAPSARTGFNSVTYLNIASNGAYVRPQQLTLSADIQMNSIRQNVGNNYRGVGLGFFGSSFATDASKTFTGLTVNPDGTLRLVTPGDLSGTGSTTYVAAWNSSQGGFSTSAFYNLTYSVDTTLGSITSVTFNGVDYTSTFSGVTGQAGLTFAPGATSVLAGFYGSTDSNGLYYGRVDNLVIAVPEPATLGLAGIGLIALLAARGRN